ncbi:uncharacterized protein LOC113767420 [Coffea eugenioides]|uniref:uncharacterized protein LOC113767420 n=1 Tax=Coffea eugenioides TaxID=49369 RepID=UPI000F60EB0C|nr:uncharacterized protein LOC113767420 [Coffea eugenioides]
MRARVVVFPIRGRNWAFSSRSSSSSLDSHSSSSSSSSHTAPPSTFKELWNTISSPQQKPPSHSNVELLIDFFANKMNRAWGKLEEAPRGTFKSKIHRLGVKLLSRVKPSEIFLKSIPKEATHVEITYPSSLNARLVRRRIRHIAIRGAVLHKKYFYGSVTLLPATAILAVLPLPNIPFFWFLFRSYSHWRALKGSEKLLQLVSDGSTNQDSSIEKENKGLQDSEKGKFDSLGSPWVLQPSDELHKLLQGKDAESANESTVSEICQRFSLKTNDVLKYRNSL